MMTLQKDLLILLVFFLPAAFYPQSLFINEFMASNASSAADPDYNVYADWVEIYNPGSFAVNIKDYSISDDQGDTRKYVFLSDIVVEPGSYLVVWTDDMNTGIHTNFKLSGSGEFIGLYDPSGNPIDEITFDSQQTDISEGRFPDGGTDWYNFFPSTPGMANPEINIYNKLLPPEFSLSGGFYQSPIVLTLFSDDPGASIYYTTDGSTPGPGSNLYTEPFTMSVTTAITAAAFRENYYQSEEAVSTYFIGFETELPVFSLVTDPANFFSDETGIYVTGINGITGNCSYDIPRNWNQDWERPVNMEFFETDKSPAFNVKAGVKINGACSRLYDMKSLGFYFRGSYGYGRLDYRLFPDIPVTSFNNFILRSGAQDWYRTMFREGMVQTLLQLGMKNSYQEYRPSVVFLNGQYWGIHNIREKMNDHYLQSHYGIDINNIDLVEISKDIFVNNGDLTAYESMINFLSEKDMSLPENYEYIKSIVDIDNYVDYLCAQIYSANADWPGSNMKLWRERTPGSKWKWLFYDLDFTFGGNAKGVYYWNTLEVATAVDGPFWPNPPWSTLMIRKMLENMVFRNEFIQRFAVHMNTTFEPGHVNNVIDSLGAVIASEIPRHKERWYKSISMGHDWVENVQVMKDFADLRQPEVRQHFYSKFNLSGSYTLTISRNNPSYGKIYTHNIEVKNNGSVNTFFRNIPLKVKAFPMPGYRFVRWEGASNSTSAETEITLSSDSYLSAVFEPAELSVTTLVINEINYKSSPLFNTDDWIELYNPVNEEINLTGWKLRDVNAENTYIFPEGAKIGGNGYLVMCRDKQKFSSLYMDIKNVYGNVEFGLSSDGEAIYLYDALDNLIDYVEYGVSGDWPLLNSANGPTLSLKDPQADNALASSWMESADYGTPGRLNDSYTNAEEESFTINEFSLANNYPNPFNPVTTIRYTVPSYKHIILKVFDALGRETTVLVNEPKSPGIYEVEFNASDLPSGIYFYQLRAGDYTETKKMALMK